jgi:hypothetical protein
MLPVEKSCVATCKNLWSSGDLGMLPVEKSCLATCKNLWSSGDLGMLPVEILCVNLQEPVEQRRPRDAAC